MDKKKARLIILLASAVYFVSYLTRLDYSVVMVDIIRSDSITKELAALPLTVLAVTYAIGQLVSGYLGDKFKPEKIILFGLLGSSLMNILITFMPLWSRPVLWGFNGFFQAMIWPPLVRILSGTFDNDTYKKATLSVSLASSFATILMYLVAPVIISFTSWHFVFIVSAGITLLLCVIWNIYSKKINYRRVGIVKKEKGEGVKVNGALIVIGVVVFSMILLGFLRDGLTDWTPTLISDAFKLSSEDSILSSVILPIFSMISISVSAIIARKFIKNEMVCAGVFFLIGAFGIFIMIISDNMLLKIFGAALAQGTTHGANYCFTCLIPQYFYKMNKTSLVAGVINCGAYIGSSIAGVGIAFVAAGGWDMVTYLWLGVSLLGVAICVAFGLFWRTFKNNNKVDA